MATKSVSMQRGDVTKEALLASAIAVFARDGFHAVSTRDIAHISGVNQALIGYHFRNKEGLYLAVFEHIAKQIKARIGPLADAIEAALEAGPVVAASRDGAGSCLMHLLRLTDGMTGMLAQENFAAWAQLITREQQAPTAAFEVLYDGFMKRVLGLMTRLILRIRGSDDEAAARLTTATILGQILVFRACRTGMLRHMAWSEVSDPELAAIQRQIRRNVTAILISKDTE